MKSLFSSTALSTGILLAAILTVPTARSFAADADDTLQEVVVTAQKRAQNVQEVPLSVQVIGAEQLAAAGVTNFEDLNRVAPSLLVRTDVTPINSTVAIRGIGTSAFGIGVEPSVAVVVDDVPLAFQSRAFGNMSDIAQVEVLAGPQSTLYGKSATAGLINITTPNPTSTLTGQIEGTTTNDREVDAAVSLAGPITNNLGFRVAANYSEFPGVIHNLYTGKNSDGDRSINVHSKLVWDPTSDISVVFNADYDNGATSNDLAWIAMSPKANLRANAAYPPSSFLGGVVPGIDNTNTYDNYGIGTKYQNMDQSLKASWDLGFATLMSIASHSYYFLDDHQDTDYTAIAALNNIQHGNFHNTQWTEEMRLVSASNQPLRYTAGLFYADVDYNRVFQRGPFFSVARWGTSEGSQQYAAFGQAEYDIIDRLTLLGGVRVGEERINYTFNDLTVLAPNLNYWSGNNSNSYVTYKAGPQYHVTDDIMLFALRSTGHKGETYNLVTGFNSLIAATGPVRPETSSDWEVGAKMQFFGHRLTVNPTLFTTDYSNFQAQGILILPNGTPNFVLENVGTVRTRGIEDSNSFRVTKDFTVGVDATYLDAHILNYPDAQCYATETLAQGCFGSPAHQNLAGANLFDAPKWKLTGNASYTAEFGAWLGVFQANYSYTSAVNYALTQDPTTIQKGYGILNTSAALHDPSDRYTMTLFLNNVLNKHYHDDIANQDSTFSSVQATDAIIPRDFYRYGGIKLSAKF